MTTRIQSSGKYTKSKVGLFSTTVITWSGDGDPPAEFLEIDLNLAWFQKPWAFWLNSALSGAIGALVTWLLT